MRPYKNLMPNADISKAILAQINREELVAMCCDVVNIASPTGEEIEMARYMRSAFEKAGLRVTWQEVEDARPNVIATLAGSGGGWLLAWWAIGLAVLALGRAIIHLLVRRWTRDGRLTRRTVIVGGGKPGEELINAIRADRTTDVEMCGVFDDRDDTRSPNMVAGLPKLGTVDDLVAFSESLRKIPVRVQECAGFLVNRQLMPYLNEAA